MTYIMVYFVYLSAMTYLKCMENTFDCNLDVSHDKSFRFAETKMCRNDSSCDVLASF